MLATAIVISTKYWTYHRTHKFIFWINKPQFIIVMPRLKGPVTPGEIKSYNNIYFDIYRNSQILSKKKKESKKEMARHVKRDTRILAE